MAGAAVIGQVDAVAQSSVQQQLAAARRKAMAIDSDLVTSCHCLIPEGFKFPIYGWCGRPAVAALPGMLTKPSVSGEKRETIWRESASSTLQKGCKRRGASSVRRRQRDLIECCRVHKVAPKAAATQLTGGWQTKVEAHNAEQNQSSWRIQTYPGSRRLGSERTLSLERFLSIVKLCIAIAWDLVTSGRASGDIAVLRNRCLPTKGVLVSGPPYALRFDQASVAQRAGDRCSHALDFCALSERQAAELCSSAEGDELWDFSSLFGHGH